MNVLFCGDFENAPIALKIDNPAETLVSDVKSRIGKVLKVPAKELILYFNDRTLPNDTPLSHWKGLRGGAAVLVGANPLRVTLQRYNSDVEVKFEIPRLVAPRWSASLLMDLCLYKGNLPYRKDGEYVLTVEGEVLKNEESPLAQSECGYKDEVIISVSFVWFFPPVSGNNASKSVCIPHGATYGQLQWKLTYPFRKDYNPYRFHNNHNPYCEDYYQGNKNYELQIKNRKSSQWSRWTLIVQAIDGSKREITLNNEYRYPALIPVFQLKRLISNENIRLTIGSTILEDWDEEGNMMLLCSYPDLHDGATLYQINLTGGIRFDLNKVSRSYRDSWQTKIHDQLHHKLNNQYLKLKPSSVYIEDPLKFTIARFLKVVENCGRESVHTTQVINDCQKSVRLHPSNDPVSTIIDSIEPPPVARSQYY